MVSDGGVRFSQDAAHHRMLQQLEQHGQKQIKLQEQLQQQKNGLREEKERSQDFKTVTQREFQLLKEEMEQLRSQCKEQVLWIKL